jgi:hypothetical protein
MDVLLNARVGQTPAAPRRQECHPLTMNPPWVVVGVADPVSVGHALASLARGPAGNGSRPPHCLSDENHRQTNTSSLKQADPRISRVAILSNPDNPCLVYAVRLLKD